MNKTESDIFEIYQNTFTPIYGDLVVIAGKKPPELLEQLESCLAHLAVAKSPGISSADSQENINAAYRHIVRAALDAAKLLWTSIQENATKLAFDEDIRTFCSNASAGEVYKQYQLAEQASVEARENELKNVGRNPEASIQDWYQAAIEYRKLHKLIDIDKIRSLKKFKFFASAKQQFVGFIFGVAASTIVSWFWPQKPVFSEPSPTEKIEKSVPQPPKIPSDKPTTN